jgi:hypothetical protein
LQALPELVEDGNSSYYVIGAEEFTLDDGHLDHEFELSSASKAQEMSEND